MQREKIIKAFKVVTVICFTVLLFVCCKSEIGGNYSKQQKEPRPIDFLNGYAGIDKMAKVELNGSGATFNAGLENDNPKKIENSFRIGKVQVTNEFWKKVYDWAVDTELAAKENRTAYAFSKKANKNYIGKTEALLPVTGITYLDSMVWCNALTEYMNFLNKDNKKWNMLHCVYYTPDSLDGIKEFFKEDKSARHKFYWDNIENKIIALRTAYEPSAEPSGSKNGLEFIECTGFNGYRLPSEWEWEFAARLRTDTDNSTNIPVCVNGGIHYLTVGKSLSGANAPSMSGITESPLALFGLGYDKAPAPVRSKTPNALECFDMSGNVWEWTLADKDRHVVLKSNGKILEDDYPLANEKGEGRRRGGAYNSTLSECFIGNRGEFKMTKETQNKSWQDKNTGFRICKTSNPVYY